MAGGNLGKIPEGDYKCLGNRELAFYYCSKTLAVDTKGNLLFFFFLLVCQFGTWKHAQQYGGIYAAWAFVILLAVSCLGRALYWACMKVSHPVQNFS